METIDFEELLLDDEKFCGSFGSIQKCYFNNKVYAYKTFSEPSYLNGKRRKLSQISTIDEPNLLTPKFWVKQNGKKNSYLSEFCYGKDIGAETENIINQLKNAKKLIQKMHSYELIHCDLISSNIMCLENIPFLTDFDNSSYENSGVNTSHLNDYSLEYVKKFGVDKALDVYIFNLLTFSLINDCGFYLVRKRILDKSYGNFSSKEAIQMCEQLFLEKTYSDKDFLIDLVDETNFKI